MTLLEAFPMNKKGFSPVQITFGSQGVILRTPDGTPASMKLAVQSDCSGQKLFYIQKVEEIYKKIDSNERLQKLKSQKTTGAVDTDYKPGDDVLFKEMYNSKQWWGPAEIIDVL